MSTEEKKNAGIKSVTRVVNYGAPEDEDETETKKEKKPKAEAKPQPVVPSVPIKNEFPTLEDSVTKNQAYLDAIKQKQNVRAMTAAQMGFEQQNQLWQRKKQEVLNEIKRLTDKYGGSPDASIFPHDAMQWQALHEELGVREKKIENLKSEYAHLILFGKLSPK